MREPLKTSRRYEVHTDSGRRLFLQSFDCIDTPVRVIVEPITAGKAPRLKGFYYHMIALLAEHCGELPKAMDRQIRENYCTPKIIEFDGEEFETRPGFDDLSKDEREKLVEVVRAICASAGVTIKMRGDYAPR